MGIKLNTKTGTYSVSYTKRHPITRQPMGLHRIGIKSKVEANRVYADLIVKVDEKIKRKVTPTWGDVLKEYLESLERTDITRTTRYNREKLLQFYTLPTWESKMIDEITSEEIHKLLNERLNDNAESYRKFFIKCIRGVFNYAFDRKLVCSNPTPLLKFKIKSKIKSVLTEDQILILLHKAQEQNWPWYPHYSVALFTGLRNGELHALTWDKVNLDKRQILVNCSWSHKDGLKSTKSGNDRIVEVPNSLSPLLRELKLKSVESDFVLPRLGRWDRGEQAYDLRLFLKAIGLHEIRFHDLRASWATLLLGKGVAPSKVMSMGGWKDMATMMVYMRKAGIDIKDSTKVLDDLHIHKIESGKLLKLPDRL
jgi:integrase